MKKLVLLLLLTPIAISIFSQNLSRKDPLLEVRFEFTGKVLNNLDSVYNVVLYTNDIDLNDIDKILVKRLNKTETVTLTRKKLKKEKIPRSRGKSKKERVIVCKHTSKQPFLGFEMIDKKGKKVKSISK